MSIRSASLRLRSGQALRDADAAGDAGHLKAVEQWVDACEFKADGPIHSLNDEYEYLIWARLLITRHEPDQALQLLTRLLQAAEDGGRRGRIIEIWILQGPGPASTRRYGTGPDNPRTRAVAG